MKKLYILLFIAGVAGLLAGCKKEKDTDKDKDKPLPYAGQVKTITQTDISPPATTAYFYDENKRIVSEKLFSNSDTLFTTYTYTASSVVITIYNDAGTILVNTYTLNSAGLAEKLTSSIGGTSDNFLYNAEGYMIRQNADTLILEDGNVIRHSLTWIPEDTGWVYTYNSKPNTIGNYNKGVFYLGKDTKNLLLSTTNGDKTKSFTYSYDTLGRVSNYTQVSDEFGSALTRSFTLTYY